MPTFDHGDATIHYDDEGSGDGEPVLLLAPGGMRSANRAWDGTPWNPRTALADLYRLIGMDQRNAGDSRAPVRAGDGWDDYAGDQLALLDHLGIERCHLVGMCIGGPFALALLATDPKRFASAALLQPVGVDDNTDTLHEMFDGWAREVADDHPEASAADWKAFRRNLWDGDFVLSVTTDQVSACATPCSSSWAPTSTTPRRSPERSSTSPPTPRSSSGGRSPSTWLPPTTPSRGSSPTTRPEALRAGGRGRRGSGTARRRRR